jgi:hypothetical protein
MSDGRAAKAGTSFKRLLTPKEATRPSASACAGIAPDRAPGAAECGGVSHV